MDHRKEENVRLDAPVLLTSRDRNFLVTQGQDPEPLYALMREWVQNPTSVSVATANRTAAGRPAKPRPCSLDDEEQCQKAAAILEELERMVVPEIKAEVESPTMETHLPRWKALRARMRLQVEYQKAVGFNRLRRRLKK